ncbi:glycoside hydrolase [Arenibacter sp. GZD96]|uniref:glycoside hydrolase family 113 n=1 Tax=Aurantibrevibacter litoralis TaxID=3106030 RepID=UPI002AFDDB88|nr:hypothetical protein [Arenibacter sp. GZD-96]MEA1785581.1 glycoside hydrolase [Arenibacter sp. GZD-96]
MKKLGFLFLVVLQVACNSQVTEKVNGVSFVASRESAAQEHAEELLKLSANYAAVMPFGFIRDMDSPEIIFDTERQWFGETRNGSKQYIELLKSNGIKVMLKPQIWIARGAFTGNLKMASEPQWQALEASYEKFILNYATLAAETQVPMFCIGTELAQFIHHRPDFWKQLIVKIKTAYKGKLTYAANWDEFAKTPFWNELDYIGIDAYFPLSDEKTPTLERLRAEWKSHKTEIASLSKKVGRPILFTEYGYRSSDYTTLKPWVADREITSINLEGQANATRALLEEFWSEDWFAGGFVWKWFINHAKSGGAQDNQFTPQNKPAEHVLRSFYQQH